MGAILKLFILFLFAILSFNAISHCGSCGEGTREDHQQVNEDDSHHDSDEKIAEQYEDDEADNSDDD